MIDCLILYSIIWCGRLKKHLKQCQTKFCDDDDDDDDEKGEKCRIDPPPPSYLFFIIAIQSASFLVCMTHIIRLNEFRGQITIFFSLSSSLYRTSLRSYKVFKIKITHKPTFSSLIPLYSPINTMAIDYNGKQEQQRKTE